MKKKRALPHFAYVTFGKSFAPLGSSFLMCVCVMVDILHVNLTGLRGTQISGRAYLSVSVRVFQEEISTWISRLNNDDPPSPVWVGIIQSDDGSK